MASEVSWHIVHALKRENAIHAAWAIGHAPSSLDVAPFDAIAVLCSCRAFEWKLSDVLVRQDSHAVIHGMGAARTQ